jgi:hypothetical protein
MGGPTNPAKPENESQPDILRRKYDGPSSVKAIPILRPISETSSARLATIGAIDAMTSAIALARSSQFASARTYPPEKPV